MSAPITIRFATDHAGAKAGMQDLAASVLSNMLKVSDAVHTGVQANGGYLASVRNMASHAAADFGSVASAGIKAANDSKASATGVAAAVVGAAAQTQAGAMVTRGALAASGEAAKFYLGILRTEMAATARLMATSPLVLSTAAAIASLVGIKLAVDFYAASARYASEALEDMAKMGDRAARLGVSTTFLQTYTAQAKNLKVEVDDLTKSLEMAKTAFTVRQGEGGEDARNESSFAARLRQQMAAGNVTAEQVARFSGASGVEAQFRVALDLMAELQSKGRELAALDLAAKIFPPEIVDRIRAGTIEFDRLRKTMDDVRNPDLVLLKPEEIARAQELERRLQEAKNTLETAAQQFRHEMAQAGIGYKEDAIAWSELMAKGASYAVGLLKQAREYQDHVEAREPAILGRDYYRPQDAPASGLRKDLKSGPTINSSGNADMDNALNRLRGNLGNPTLIEQAQRASRAMTEPFFGNRTDRTAPIRSKPHASSESFDAVESYINGLEKTAAAAKAEAEAFGKSNAEKAAAIALARLKETADQNGITVTAEQTAKVREAAEATARYKDQLQDLEQAERQAAELQRMLWGGIADNIGDAILNGKSFLNVLNDLGSMLTRASLNAIMTGTGPLAGLFGTAPAASAGSNAVGGLAGVAQTFVAGFRANGGPVQAGRAYTVGEMGQELFVPNSDGRMVPIARGGGLGGGGFNVTVINNAGDQVQATPQRRSDGGLDLIVDQVDSALARRVGRGQGALAGITPGGRMLRG